MEEEQRKGMHIIIFTRALGGRGHGRMHKGKDGGKGDWKIERLKDWKGRRQEEGEIVAREENTKKRVETGVF